MSAVDEIAAYLAHLKTGGNRIDQIIFDELSKGEGMTATDELLPCPFCGGKAKAYQHGDVGFVVQCRRCGIWNAGYSPAWSHITEDEFHGYVTKDYAIAAWNRRAK